MASKLARPAKNQIMRIVTDMAMARTIEELDTLKAEAEALVPQHTEREWKVQNKLAQLIKDAYLDGLDWINQ